MRTQEDSSPEKLNTTESILTSLYDRLVKQSQNSEQPASKQKTKQQEKHSISAYKPNHGSQNQLLNTESPILNKAILFTQPNESILVHLKNNTSLQEGDIDQKHQHSSDCCSISNVFIKDKLKRAAKNQYLLQSYREEVEYLKKLSFLQSQEIQKLRRMLRSQHEEKPKQQAHQQKRRLSVMDKKQIQKISNKKAQVKQTSLKLKPAKKNSQVVKQTDKNCRKKVSDI